PGPSRLNGGSATLRNSSSVSLPSLLASSSMKVRIRYLRKSARVTSPFFSVSVSWNQIGSGTGAVVVAAGGAGRAVLAGGAGAAGAAGAAGGAVCAGAAGGRLAGHPWVGGVWAAAGRAI